MKSSACLIVNPVSGRFSKKTLQKVKSILSNRFDPLEVYFTHSSSDATQAAREYANREFDVLIAFGGDGTLNEVVNGVALSRSSVGFIPAGTTNVFAKETGIPEEPEKAAELIVNGTSRQINLGCINNQRYFLLMAGIGFDAEAVCNIKKGLKKGLGKLAYILSGFEVFLKKRPSELTVTIDGESVIRCYGAIICNASKYAGNFIVCPDASVFRPELQAFLIKKGDRLSTLKYVFGIITGKHLKYKDAAFIKGSHFKVQGHTRVQIDGDCFGNSPVEVSIRENAVKIILGE